MTPEVWPEDVVEAVRSAVLRCRCLASCDCCHAWPHIGLYVCITDGRRERWVHARVVLTGDPTAFSLCGNSLCLRWKHTGFKAKPVKKAQGTQTGAATLERRRELDLKLRFLFQD